MVSSSSALATVSDCSSVQYCTEANQALNYGSQYILTWNNQMSPLNSQSLVTVSVYSIYDLTTPIFDETGISNTNGQISVQPDADWFSRYTGSDDSTGENQTVYFAVYLQGNDPPAVSSMLQLKLTATSEQYQQIKETLQAEASASSASLAALLSSSTSLSGSSSLSSSMAASDTSDVSLKTEVISGVTQTETVTLSPGTDTVSESNGRSGLSDGAIAGIVVGSVVGLLLLLLLLLLPLYLRRRRSKRLLTKTGGGASGDPSGGADTASASSERGRGSGEDEGVPAMAMPVPARHTSAEKRQHLDTPLLIGNRPNNSSSFTSQDDGSTYQPLSLESPRVLIHMPSSTRAAAAPGVNPEAGLSTDDARHIGESFRDAMRKAPQVSDEDDDVDEDPGWRERVAKERMQRELDSADSVVQSVVVRTQGSGDLSFSTRSPPPT
ncbi:hypothetical protein EV175_001902 [Coemansia sp. RSA 1933]|nr:hypothetical protein EV175_001902 [Coemansia sp. RSA 1933]